jgi:hypothetical protein
VRENIDGRCEPRNNVIFNWKIIQFRGNYIMTIDEKFQDNYNKIRWNNFFYVC